MSKKTPRQLRREETFKEIKATATRLMAQAGTAGLSVRAITREMGLTAPALYRYYDSLDDLITDLIVDAFNDLADALETSRVASAGQHSKTRLLAAAAAYRRWALDNPVRFQLIYGNPIPGYVAPREVTVPAVTRGFVVLVELFAAALAGGELQPAPAYNRVPPPLASAIRRMARPEGTPAPAAQPPSPLALYLAVVGWTRIHGIIMLELFNHLQPVVGNVDAYYELQVTAMLDEMGMV